MKNLILEGYAKVEPQALNEQLLLACKKKRYGSVDINSVIAQYKYCLQHSLDDAAGIFYDYLHQVIGGQLDIVGGKHAK